MTLGTAMPAIVVVVTLELVVVGGAVVVVVVRCTACRWPGEPLHEANAQGATRARATRARGPVRCMASLCPVPSVGSGHRCSGAGGHEAPEPGRGQRVRARGKSR